MIELHNVTKRFGALTALDGISLKLGKAHSLAILGQSGCGKSTLLRLLVGLEQPDSGEVLIDGQRLDPSTLPGLRRRIGYVIQEGGLFPHLTAEQNIGLMARHVGWPESRVKTRVAELAVLARFPSERLSRWPLELSGGQRQRVALMRALMLDPEVVLLDEPLAALDPMIRSELQADLRRIFTTLRKTVVLVTHDVNEAAYIADRIVLLRDGRVLQAGTLNEMEHAPADPFVTQFLNAQRGAVGRGADTHVVPKS
jgi:osmoprotectant transport system ATP-binding protein